MRERCGLFAPSKHAVLSLAVQAEDQSDRREQGQFEILVRHIFYRFLHNELLTCDDDETRLVERLCATCRQLATGGDAAEPVVHVEHKQ